MPPKRAHARDDRRSSGAAEGGQGGIPPLPPSAKGTPLPNTAGAKDSLTSFTTNTGQKEVPEADSTRLGRGAGCEATVQPDRSPSRFSGKGTAIMRHRKVAEAQPHRMMGAKMGGVGLGVGHPQGRSLSPTAGARQRPCPLAGRGATKGGLGSMPDASRALRPTVLAGMVLSGRQQPESQQGLGPVSVGV